MLFAAAATVAAANGGGSADTGPSAGTAAPRTPGLRSPDAGFARDMAVHHQQAVEMSFIVRDRTQDEAVRTLAYDIANTQANQRGMLLGWLDLWGLPKVLADEPPMSWMGASGGHGGHAGHDTAKPGALMPGMATKEELDRLGAASGRDAEVLFLQLMTDHHKGGVAMAEGCAQQCETPVERALAQGMVDAQRSELTLMEDMLRQRGAAPRG
ncbi:MULTISPECIES: DUF305 domain-containing protein [Streptomyces]|uniref:DUF305 domain-containing protein n=1 Tax=Streptomyces TaxID=1883 RepID=UPI002E29CDA5|nr:DUF305 domain-containing protein [Streptomyces virginiae]